MAKAKVIKVEVTKVRPQSRARTVDHGKTRKEKQNAYQM